MHQLMIVFPLGLLLMSLVFDLIGVFTKFGQWHWAAFSMIGAGVVTGFAAALPGIWDWIHIPSGTRAKAIGLWHGIGNIAVLTLFTVGWLIRQGEGDPSHPSAIPIVVSFVAAGLGGVTAWLGGELVGRLGVGIDNGANLNAPNSLSKRPASNTPSPITAPPPK